MKTSTETTLSYFVVGLAVGAIGGFVAALVARKETRGLLRERSAKSLEYLDQRWNTLRETTEGIVNKGEDMLSQRCCSREAPKGDGPRSLRLNSGQR